MDITARHTASRPRLRAPQRARRAGAAGLLALGLLFTAACSGDDAETEPEAEPTPGQAVDLGEAPTTEPTPDEAAPEDLEDISSGDDPSQVEEKVRASLAEAMREAEKVATEGAAAYFTVGEGETTQKPWLDRLEDTTTEDFHHLLAHMFDAASWNDPTSDIIATLGEVDRLRLDETNLVSQEAMTFLGLIRIERTLKDGSVTEATQEVSIATVKQGKRWYVNDIQPTNATAVS